MKASQNQRGWGLLGRLMLPPPHRSCSFPVTIRLINLSLVNEGSSGRKMKRSPTLASSSVKLSVRAPSSARIIQPQEREEMQEWETQSLSPQSCQLTRLFWALDQLLIRFQNSQFTSLNLLSQFVTCPSGCSSPGSIMGSPLHLTTEVHPPHISAPGPSSLFTLCLAAGKSHTQSDFSYHLYADASPVCVAF